MRLFSIAGKRSFAVYVSVGVGVSESQIGFQSSKQTTSTDARGLIVVYVISRLPHTIWRVFGGQWAEMSWSA